MNIQIKSIVGQVHDTGFGGYPYKVIVMVEIASKEFNKLPVLHKKAATMFGPSKTVRDLGNLVFQVNNEVYTLNHNIPAHNPSIDSEGAKRAKNGIKTMEFVYFFKDHAKAEALGFEQFKMKSGEVVPKYNTYVDILANVKKASA